MTLCEDVAGLAECLLPLENRYRAPDALPPDVVCYQITIPDDPQYLYAVRELLSRLAFLEVWDTDETTIEDWEAAGLGGEIELADCPEETPPVTMTVGMIMFWPGAGVPSGWLACHGETLSKTTYPELFAAIGYFYGGSGDNFVLPNLKDRMVVGTGGDGGTFALGNTGGDITHTLTVSEIPAHTHAHNRAATSDANGPRHMHGTSGTGTTQGGSTGGGAAHNNMPPYLALVPLIRAVP